MALTDLEVSFAGYIEQAVRLENLNEAFRRQLCELPNFNPEAIFQTLDTTKKGYITHNDLSRLLRKHRKIYKPEDLCGLIATFNSDGISRWNKSEFERFLSPADVLVQALFSYKVQSGKEISEESEHELAEHLAQEIETRKRLRTWRKVLEKSSGFSILQCFTLVDTCNCGSISSSELNAFFMRNNRAISPEDTIIFIRRFGAGENKITYKDFEKVLFPINLPSDTPMFSFKTPVKEKYEAEEKLVTPSTGETEVKPVAESPGPFKIIKKCCETKTQHKTALNFPKKLPTGYLEFIQSQAEINRKIEAARIALAVRADFTLLDGYSVIDPEFSGSADPEKLYQGLHRLGSEMKEGDTFLFLKNCAFAKNEALSYSGFCALVQPINEEVKSIMKQRKPRYGCTKPLEEFTARTKELFKNVVELLIEREDIHIQAAIKLSKSIYFNPKATFELLDYEQNGFITFTEVHFCQYNAYTSSTRH
eukprot:TRINITY_DN358_c0_g2_i1.p1 TRINITY_DN358_c0_g2~~TRINITY_DN358_c0_g2_i1.p1  ORF type:complete len:502 (-),score=38.05 TRINITY_DN358_c0_g2_i1:2113-3549(-)